MEFAKEKGLDVAIADKYDLHFGSEDVKLIMEHPESIYTEEELSSIEKVLSPKAFDDFKAVVRSFSEAKAIMAEEERIKNYNGGEALTKAFVLYDIAQRRLFAEHQGDERWFRRSEYIIKADGTTTYGGVNQQPKEGESLGSKWVLKNSAAKELMTLIATSPVTEKVPLLEMMPSGLQRYLDIPSREERQAKLRSLSDDQLDALYISAMPGNKAVMRDVLDVMAERRGYTLDSSYQGTSAFNGAAPSKNAYFETAEERKQAWENGEYDGDMSLADYIDSGIDTNDLEWQLTDRGEYRRTDAMRRECIDGLRQAVNSGTGTVKMYRSVPSSVEEGQFRNGDWITPSKSYAIENAAIHGWGDNFRIIEQDVPVGHVWWDGNDIAEWGYDDGKEYRYKNTLNNAKSNDLITYDDQGNVILPSKRFDDRTADIRYMLVPDSQSPIFISNALLALNKIKQEKATPEQWLKMLEKNGGIKSGEDRWTGLSQWLKDSQEKVLTKADISAYLSENMIQVEEVTYSELADVDNNPKMQALSDEFHELMAQGEEETGSIFTSDWADWAFEEMVNNYGDDFRSAFEVSYDRNSYPSLSPQYDWGSYLSEAARYYLDIEDKPIDSTRLDYTTEGLVNKREIALTVPTIESWNSSDEVHFGDAQASVDTGRERDRVCQAAYC